MREGEIKGVWIDEMQKAPNRTLAETINQKLAELKDGPEGLPLLQAGGPFQTSVVTHQDVYRTTSTIGGEKFLLESVREGKRTDFIFVLSVADKMNHSYKCIEIKDKDISNIIGLEPVLVQMLGQDPSERDWSYAKRSFTKNIKQANAKAAIEEKKGTQKTHQRIYGDNKLWGMFS